MFHPLKETFIKLYIVTDFCYDTLENDLKRSLIPRKISLLNHHFFSSLGACTFQTMILHQQPLRTTNDILSPTNSPLLIADIILWCTKNPVPN